MQIGPRGAGLPWPRDAVRTGRVLGAAGEGARQVRVQQAGAAVRSVRRCGSVPPGPFSSRQARHAVHGRERGGSRTLASTAVMMWPGMVHVGATCQSDQHDMRRRLGV